MRTTRSGTRGPISMGHEPLPLPLRSSAASRARATTKVLDDGCYLLNYSPAGAPLVTYDGTLRVHAGADGLVASGDLYSRDTVVFEPPPSANGEESPPVEILTPAPDPSAGIPIFPIDHYRYYLQVTEIAPAGDGFTLAFETRRFGPVVTLLNGQTTRFPLESALTTDMHPEPAPPGYPRPDGYFAGDVTNEEGTIVGRLSMGFVSPSLRKATIEIDRVYASELPLDNGAGVSWKTVFDDVGWDLTIVASNNNISEPIGGVWNKADAHAAMALHRDTSDLDTEWRYYILAVRQTNIDGGERGIMFDASGGPNNVPREGVLVTSHWEIPDEEMWGLLRGKRTGETVTYFRTAVHEVGHAMGLDHPKPEVDTFVMRQTDGIARSSTAASSPPFPNNIKWSFSAEDGHRLRHWPDLIVRPGGLVHRAGDSAPSGRFLSAEHSLTVTAPATPVPLGAPLRVEVQLTNISSLSTKGPLSLSLSSGAVCGKVVDAFGAVRTFSPLTIDESATRDQILGPGEKVEASLTLFAGAEGALFPQPGTYRVIVEATWPDGGLLVLAVGETSFTVAAAQDSGHAEAARRVLTTPDVLLTIAFGGDHLTEGIAAIGAALDNAILRPHFAWIEAKRVGTRFGQRLPDLNAAAAFIDETTVMSADEFRRAIEMIQSDAGSAGAQALAKSISARIARGDVSDEIRALIG